MLDPEDLVMWPKPDERSIMTQVAAFYKCFASFQGDLAASKIATALKVSQEHERLIQQYEEMASDLLRWTPVLLAVLRAPAPCIGNVFATLHHLVLVYGCFVKNRAASPCVMYWQHCTTLY